MRLPRWLTFWRRPKANGLDRTALSLALEDVFARALRHEAIARGCAEAPGWREVQAWLATVSPRPFSTNALYRMAVEHFFPDPALTQAEAV